MVFLLADIAAAGRSSHHHRDRRPAADRRAARRPARARLGPRARRRAGAGAGFGDRGQRRRARLHHAGGRRPTSSSSSWRAARGRITLPGGSFATSRKIPEEVFRTGEPRIVADLLDGDLANVHMGTVALGIRNVLCVPLRLVRYLDQGRGRRRGAPHRRALSRQPREGLAALRAPRAPRSRRWPPKPPSRSRTPASIARRWRRRGWSRRCGSPPRSSRRCCPRPAGSGAFFRAAAASLPCRSIGGDFYDYVDLPDGSLGLRARRRRRQGAARGAAERDDAGHLRGAGGDQRRAVADRSRRVNLALYRRGIESRFVTLMYGVARRRTAG